MIYFLKNKILAKLFEQVEKRLKVENIDSALLAELPKKFDITVENIIVCRFDENFLNKESVKTNRGFIFLAENFTSNIRHEIIISGNEYLELEYHRLLREEAYTEQNSLVIRALINKLSSYFNKKKRIESYMTDSFGMVVANTKLEMANAEIKKLNEELSRLSKTDYLTKLPNRRALMEAAKRELFRSVRNKENINYFLSKENKANKKMSSSAANFKKNQAIGNFIGTFTCAIIDIDYFKKVNDTYGHIVGDRVLAWLGELLKDDKIFRFSDICGRYGGEEFLILFPDTSMKNAICPMEKLFDAIRKKKFQSDDGREFGIKISAGLSELNENDNYNIDFLISRADKALYWAKENGRDRFKLYDTSLSNQKIY